MGQPRNILPHLKDKLLPPTDQAVSALLDDLSEGVELDTTLVVTAGEFGRTPQILTLPGPTPKAARITSTGAIRSPGSPESPPGA